MIYFGNTLVLINTEVALHRCSYKKLFWKYAANLQENTHAKVSLPEKFGGGGGWENVKSRYSHNICKIRNKITQNSPELSFYDV